MLLAQDILSLAEKFSKDVDEVHKVFYEVSCNRDALIKVLENKSVKCRWSQLEDLALKDLASEAFKHVQSTKGTEEVERRRKFLQIWANF